MGSIKLQTADQHDIPNDQNFDPWTQIEIQNRRDVFTKKFPRNIERNVNPTCLYNCHGLTFGSRRTNIDGTQTLRMILKDDRYKKIDKPDVLPGDIVLFVAPNGDIEHSAVVLEPPNMSILGFPKVVGKWGNFTEYVHYANYSDYDASNLEYYRVEWP